MATRKLADTKEQNIQREEILFLIFSFILRSCTIQSHEGAAVFLTQNPHEGGKPLTGISAPDPIS